MSRRTSHVEGSLFLCPPLQPSATLTDSLLGMVEDNSFNELLDFPVDQDFSAPDDFLSNFEFPSTGTDSFDLSMQVPFHDMVSPCVSPQDVQLHSEPASTAFTNLTTPESTNWESPLYNHSTDTSPIFAADNNVPESGEMFPLFGENDPFYDANVAQSIEQPAPDAPVATQMSRDDSSLSLSSARTSNQGRHASAVGVSSRRRDKPLPAIVVDDPNDTVKLKRARNTLAARKSRQKRLIRHEELEAQVAELETQVDYWKRAAEKAGHRE